MTWICFHAAAPTNATPFIAGTIRISKEQVAALIDYCTGFAVPELIRVHQQLRDWLRGCKGQRI
jgi:hypothetical protein